MEERAEEHIVYPEISWSPYTLGFRFRNMMYFFGAFPFYAEPDEIDDCRFTVRCPRCGCCLLDYDDNTYLRDAHECVEIEVERACPDCGVEIIVPRREDDIAFDISTSIHHIATDGAEGWSLFVDANEWGRMRYHLVHDDHCAEAIASGWELVTEDNAEQYDFDHQCFHYRRHRDRKMRG